MTRITLPPTQLNNYAERYLIREEISTDRYAKRYHAYDRKKKKYVELHALHPHLYKNVIHRQTIYTRLRTRAAIEHPNLVPILNVGIAEDKLVWITPLRDKAKSLDHLQFGHLSNPQITLIMEQLGQSITHLHTHDFIHGQIASHHILHQPNGTVQLTGCVLLDQYDTVTINDALYLSPEQAETRKPLTSPKADIYALGIVLYRMIEGELPIEVNGLRPETVLQWHITGSLPPLTHLKQWQIPVFDMVRRDPTNRKFAMPTPHHADSAQAGETKRNPRSHQPIHQPMQRGRSNRSQRWSRRIRSLFTMPLRRKWLTMIITALLIVGFVMFQHGSLIGTQGASTIDEFLFTVQDHMTQISRQIGFNEPQSTGEITPTAVSSTPIP